MKYKLDDEGFTLAQVVLIIAGIIVIALIIIGIFHIHNSSDTKTSLPGETITGKITALPVCEPVNTGCTVQLDNYNVRISIGTVAPQPAVGKLINFGSNSEITSADIGKSVQVYGSKIESNDYTLVGSTSYYMKLLN